MSKTHFVIEWSWPDTPNTVHEADIYAENEDDAVEQYRKLFPRDVVHTVRPWDESGLEVDAEAAMLAADAETYGVSA